VIELVDRLEAENERWISVLFEHDGREEHRFQAVRASVADDAAKTAERGAAAWLCVVGQAIQVALDLARRIEARKQGALRARESDHLAIWLFWHFQMPK
jgi:hypothetical protein